MTWDKECSIYQCSDGGHNSFWLSIVQTPEWEAWYKHASKNKLYDVAECAGCGWASKKHMEDFLLFVRTQYIPPATLIDSGQQKE